MSTKTIKLPSDLEVQARKIADREGVSVERFVTHAVTAMIGADQALQAGRRMNKQAAKKRLREILAKAPDVPPLRGDEMPADPARAKYDAILPCVKSRPPLKGDEIPPELAAKIAKLREARREDSGNLGANPV
jgi:hypothetical protein